MACWTGLAGNGGFSDGVGTDERRGGAIDGYCATLDSIHYEPDDNAGGDVGEWLDDYAY